MRVGQVRERQQTRENMQTGETDEEEEFYWMWQVSQSASLRMLSLSDTFLFLHFEGLVSECGVSCEMNLDFLSSSTYVSLPGYSAGHSQPLPSYPPPPHCSSRTW